MFGRLIKPPSTPRTAPKAVIGKKGVAPTVIAADLSILGNLVSDGIIDIDGQVDGNITCHTVIVRENGRIHGDITAEIAHVYGAVEGVIRSKTVNLCATARVVGMIMHETLTIADGAFVDGKFSRTDKEYVDATILNPDTGAQDIFTTPYDDGTADSAAEIRVLERLRLVQ